MPRTWYVCLADPFVRFQSPSPPKKQPSNKPTNEHSPDQTTTLARPTKNRFTLTTPASLRQRPAGRDGVHCAIRSLRNPSSTNEEPLYSRVDNAGEPQTTTRYQCNDGATRSLIRTNEPPTNDFTRVRVLTALRRSSLAAECTDSHSPAPCVSACIRLLLPVG